TPSPRSGWKRGRVRDGWESIQGRRDFVGARRSLKLEAVASSLVLLGGRALYAHGLADPPNANAGVFPGVRRVRAADDFPLAGLIGEAIADPKLHREDLGVARL